MQQVTALLQDPAGHGRPSRGKGKKDRKKAGKVTAKCARTCSAMQKCSLCDQWGCCGLTAAAPLLQKHRMPACSLQQALHSNDALRFRATVYAACATFQQAGLCPCMARRACHYELGHVCRKDDLLMQDEEIPWMVGGVELDFHLDTQGLAETLDPNMILDSFHTSEDPSGNNSSRQLVLDNFLPESFSQPHGSSSQHFDDEAGMLLDGQQVVLLLLC